MEICQILGMSAPSDTKFDHVNYDVLDSAKLTFIEASKRTVNFAKEHGFIPDESFGASANVFELNLKPFLKAGQESLHITLIPEGLGTADDARPEDLTADELTRFWYNIGIKTVSVMTNDAASAGMQTILIGLYLPSSEPEKVFTQEFQKGFLDGFVDGCQTVGCVYFSGETPQLKNKITPGKLDIAGALFGFIPAGKKAINPRDLKAGDTIVLVESSGPHENGFTTFRALAPKLPKGFRTDIGNGQQFWEAINSPSKLYTPLIQALLKEGLHPTNAENITGHGWQKIMRPKASFEYVIDEMLPVPEVFKFVERSLAMTPHEMISVFNYGVGLALFFRDKEEAHRAVKLAATVGLKACVAGTVKESAERKVTVKQLNATLLGSGFALAKA